MNLFKLINKYHNSKGNEAEALENIIQIELFTQLHSYLCTSEYDWNLAIYNDALLEFNNATKMLEVVDYSRDGKRHNVIMTIDDFASFYTVIFKTGVAQLLLEDYTSTGNDKLEIDAFLVNYDIDEDVETEDINDIYRKENQHMFYI